jgi:hypothetical protein
MLVIVLAALVEVVLDQVQLMVWQEQLILEAGRVALCTTTFLQTALELAADQVL